MNTAPSGDFDFDDWAALAIRDPQAFEARRTEFIEGFLARLPSDRRQRLRRLQWRIDRERDRSGTPLAACIRISRMMWDSVAGEGGLVDSLSTLEGRRLPRRRPSATVLPFPGCRH